MVNMENIEVTSTTTDMQTYVPMVPVPSSFSGGQHIYLQEMEDGVTRQVYAQEAATFEVVDGNQQHLSLEIGSNHQEAQLMQWMDPNPVYKYLLGPNGTLIPVFDSIPFDNTVTVVAANGADPDGNWEEDDDEVLSYVLDHNYARKPKDPATVVAPRPRKRLKKKEPVASSSGNEQFILPAETASPNTTKVNIIRRGTPPLQLSTSRNVIPTRPNILQQQPKPLPAPVQRSFNLQTNDLVTPKRSQPKAYKLASHPDSAIATGANGHLVPASQTLLPTGTRPTFLIKTYTGNTSLPSTSPVSSSSSEMVAMPTNPSISIPLTSGTSGQTQLYRLHSNGTLCAVSPSQLATNDSAVQVGSPHLEQSTSEQNYAETPPPILSIEDPPMPVLPVELPLSSHYQQEMEEDEEGQGTGADGSVAPISFGDSQIFFSYL